MITKHLSKKLSNDKNLRLSTFLKVLAMLVVISNTLVTQSIECLRYYLQNLQLLNTKDTW